MQPHPFEQLKKTLSSEQINLLNRGLAEQRAKFAQRFPLPITLIGALGVISFYFGLEKILEKTIVGDQPWIMVLVGLILMIITGSLYKRLGGPPPEEAQDESEDKNIKTI